MTRVLITDYPWPDLDIERGVLAQLPAELIESPSTDESTLAELASDVNAIMTCWAPVTRAVIEAAGRCRHVARLGIGMDNIDVDAAIARGMTVTRIPDYCVEEIAEHALALLLTLARKTAWYHDATKRGRYDINEGYTPLRVRGKVLGIVGLGNSGRRLATMARGIGLKVVACSRTQSNPMEGVSWRTLHALLAESDFVSLHCPLTDETRHLIDADAFATMKPGAFLINTSRGGLVDSDALAAALANGQLAGAALDVQEPEPPDLSRAPWNDARVVVTPHAAFLSPQSVADLRQRVAQQVVDFLSGRRPENVVAEPH